MQDGSEGPRWHWAARIAFRFLLVYFALAFFSAIWGLLPVVGMLGYWHDEAARPFYAWIGKTAFGIEITVFPNGSGDTTYNWMQFASHLVFATVAVGDDPSKAPLVGTLSFTRDGEKTLRLTGEVAGARVEAGCERLDAKSFLLMNRGFHRVNESPFNR